MLWIMTPGCPMLRVMVAVVLFGRAGFEQLDWLDYLDEVARSQVVGLAGTDDLLGPVGVGRNDRLNKQPQ